MQTVMNIQRFFRSAPLLSACLLVGLGCGGSTERVVSVSGKVTHNGQPVTGIVVSFVPEAKTETGVSTGEPDQNGDYRLTVSKTGSSGAVVGKHKVWVSLHREPLDRNTKLADKEEKSQKMKSSKSKKKGAPAAENIPAELAPIIKKYGDQQKTPLTVEVKGGESVDLKLD
jgi:hypothetical protein